MKQQTAVEWLYNILCDKGYFKKLPVSEFKEALKMENEQLTDAHIEGQRVFDVYDHTEWSINKAEEYFKKTYNK